MQIAMKFVLGALALASLATASQYEGLTVNVERRDLSDAVDNVKGLKSMLNQVFLKYQTGMFNFKHRTGKDHIFDGHHKMKRGNTGIVPLEDISNETLWIGEISLGTPSKTIRVHFDTGSADFVISEGPYYPSKSNTSIKTNKKFEQHYVDGTSVTGDIFADDFSIGGIHAKNLSIGVSKKKFSEKFEKDNKGIAGLAFPSIQHFDTDYPSLFGALKEQHKLKKNVFQFTLKTGEGSTVNFGDIDSSKYKGDLTWVDVNPFWGFYVKDAKVNGKQIISAIDSGSTFIIGSKPQVKEVFDKTPGVSYVEDDDMAWGAFDCNITPNVTINYGGTDFKLSRDQVLARAHAGKKCLLSIVGMDSVLPLNTWIMGDPFFRAVSIVFDHDNNRLGFAPQA